MSVWFFRRPKRGRSQVWLIDLPLLPVVAIATVSVGLFLSFVRLHPMPAALGSIGVMLLGYALVVFAKVSLFRRGVWVSWGTRLMSAGAARLYHTGYGLMEFGAAILLMAWTLAA